MKRGFRPVLFVSGSDGRPVTQAGEGMLAKANGKNVHNGNGNGGPKSNGHNGQKGINGHHKNGHGGHNRVTSLIGPGLAFHGSLVGEGGIRIDGTFRGEINILGPLVITEAGKVISEDIRAGVVSVAGSVRGNITARQVEILAGGRVWGDVTTAAFASEDGAFLRGQVKMLDEVELVAQGA